MARKKVVVITGGAGFLGSHLCDRFIAETLAGRVEGFRESVGAQEHPIPGLQKQVVVTVGEVRKHGCSKISTNQRLDLDEREVS